MARAQGSLEYMVIIAVILAISSIVIMYTTGIVGGQKSSVSISSCKQASIDCKLSKMGSPTDPCNSCETACMDSTGAELFQGAVSCCAHAKTDLIYEESNDCTGCLQNSDCLSGQLCYQKQCVDCYLDTQCSSPTPYCVNNKCIQCQTDSNCPLGTHCSSGFCASGCLSDANCPTGQPHCYNNLCVACSQGSHCSAPTPYCVNNVCVQCTLDSQCLSGQICSNGACAAGCVDDSGCPSGQYCCGTPKLCRAPTCTSPSQCTNIPNDCKTPTCTGTGCLATCNPTGANEGAGAFCKSTDHGASYCGDNAVCETITTYACDGTGNCQGTPSTSCTGCGTCGYCEGAVCYDGYDSPGSCAKSSCRWCTCTGSCAGLEGCSSTTCYNFCKWC